MALILPVFSEQIWKKQNLFPMLTPLVCGSRVITLLTEKFLSCLFEGMVDVTYQWVRLR